MGRRAGSVNPCLHSLSTAFPQGYQHVVTTFAWLTVGASALLSAISLAGACYALLRAEKPRLIALERAVADYRMEAEALANSYDSVRQTVKRINSRYAMRDKRARDKDSPGQGDLPDPSTDPEAWRDAIQRKYPRGVFSINGTGNGR